MGLISVAPIDILANAIASIGFPELPIQEADIYIYVTNGYPTYKYINATRTLQPATLPPIPSNIVIQAGAAFSLGAALNLSIGGTLTIKPSFSLTPQSATISIPNGSMFPYFTYIKFLRTVSFTDHTYADGSGGAIVAWAWTFGDGSTSTLQNPSHTYAISGTYTAVLKTTDADGNTATCTEALTV